MIPLATSTSMLGASVLEAFIAAHIIIPSCIKLNRGGQGQKQPVDPERMTPRTQQRKIPAHAEKKKRRRKENTHEEFPRLIPDFRLGAPSTPRLRRQVSSGRDGTIAGILNCRNHLLHIGHGRGT